jgi:Pyruvate/2-oxoacid:ferredoxin oxidoreductase delta subunit
MIHLLSKKKISPQEAVYFRRKGEITGFAEKYVSENKGTECIRCTLECAHARFEKRQVILLVKGNIIVERLIRCGICANNKLGKEVCDGTV